MCSTIFYIYVSIHTIFSKASKTYVANLTLPLQPQCYHFVSITELENWPPKRERKFMKIFLKISVLLLALATIMVVITMFEFKENRVTYRRSQLTNEGSSLQETKINNENNVDR